MNVKAAIACAIALSACGKDKDKNNDEKSNQTRNLVYQDSLKGNYVSIAGWELTLPAVDKDAQYRWSDDTLSKTVVSDFIPVSILSVDGRTKSEFKVQLTTNQCQDYKSEPASGEIGGRTERGVNWFVKNDGGVFESFTATSKFVNCISMTLVSDDKSFGAVTKDSSLLHYFELIADGIKFNRFALVSAGYQRINPFLFTTFGKGMTLVTDAEAITSGISESPFFTEDTRTNAVQNEAKSGDCQKPVFQNAWNDPAKKDSNEVNKGLVAKEKAGVVQVDGKYNWVTEGVFKTEDGTKCLILKFSLRNSVEFEDLLKSDSDLASRFSFELGLTQRADVNE